MEMESCVPPGFRFHPTEEELVGYYLKRKIQNHKFDINVIVDIDLYKMEPWDFQASCRLGYDEQKEWYFFSHKDRKYPTGTRTNRATAAGFWKATGRDKAVLSKNRIIGMRKTLVFYKGRAPNGRKTEWIMHEYRLQTSEHGPPQEEGWVVCRAFKKPSPNQMQGGYEAWNHAYNGVNNINHVRSPPFSDTVNTTQMFHPNQSASFHQHFGSEPDQVLLTSQTFLDKNNHLIPDLPQLDSPSTLSPSFAAKEGNINNLHHNHEDYDEERSINNGTSTTEYSLINWKNLDNLLSSSTSSQVINDTATLFSSHDTNNNLPISIPQNFELEASHVSHFLGCFPDL